jgi:hypothetical protein
MIANPHFFQFFSQKLANFFCKKKGLLWQNVPFYFYFSHFTHKNNALPLTSKNWKKHCVTSVCFWSEILPKCEIFWGACNTYKCLDFIFFWKKSPIKQGFWTGLARFKSTCFCSSPTATVLTNSFYCATGSVAKSG